MSSSHIAEQNGRVPSVTPGGWRLFVPKSVTVLRQEGYSWAFFRDDAIAGFTVAVVALPLAMAIAIASGATPQAGLITAVIAGFLISALGGSLSDRRPDRRLHRRRLWRDPRPRL